MNGEYKETVIDKHNKNNITAYGYFFIAISDSFHYKGIKLMATKANMDWMEIVTTRLMLAGFQQLPEEDGERKITISKCKKCNKSYESDKRVCDCGNKCIQYPVMMRVLEPMGSLAAQIQEIMKKDKTNGIIRLINEYKSLKQQGDSFILRGWG